MRDIEGHEVANGIELAIRRKPRHLGFDRQSRSAPSACVTSFLGADILLILQCSNRQRMSFNELFTLSQQRDDDDGASGDQPRDDANRLDWNRCDGVQHARAPDGGRLFCNRI